MKGAFGAFVKKCAKVVTDPKIAAVKSKKNQVVLGKPS